MAMKLVKPIKKAPVVTEIPAEPKQVKSVTIRMPPNTLGLLDNAVASYDSDRTDVIKRAVRLLSACLSGHNSCILITDKAGKTKEITMVIAGVPT